MMIEINDNLDELRMKDSSFFLDENNGRISFTSRWSFLEKFRSNRESKKVDDSSLSELNEEIAIPQTREVESAIEILHNYFHFSEKYGNKMYSSWKFPRVSYSEIKQTT